MDSRRKPGEGSTPPPIITREELLKNMYTASTSSIYRGRKNLDSSLEDSDDSKRAKVAKKKRDLPPLLHTPEAHRIRRELRYFFMNPIQKWHARRRFPWKLLVQIAKIILVTSQLVLFSQDSLYHHSYHTNTRVTLSNLFLKDWDTTDEVLTYPPAGGPKAVYTKTEFFEHLDYAIANFARIKDVSVASYEHKVHEGGTEVPGSFCIQQYECYDGCVQADTGLFLNRSVIQKCISIMPSEAKSSANWTLEDFLEHQNFSLNFQLLLHARFNFVLQALRLRVQLPDLYPDCHLLNATITLDNKIGGSQMVIDFEVHADLEKCHRTLELNRPRKTTKVWDAFLDGLGLIVCFLSGALCSRSLHRARHLKTKTNVFFQENVGRPLTWEEKREFLNVWYVIITVNDVILIAGIYLKVGLEIGTYKGIQYMWSVCALCLGLGNFLTWVGILRYLGFYDNYNAMILTMKKCAPYVLRLLICILIIFFGYAFAGWLILGPYHLKFQTFMTSMECLFSLVNGDDMFASFFSTSGGDPFIWYFSRIYLYSFISLFMWIVLSIFVAVIMDAYETIKDYYDEGFPRTGLMKFVSECSEKYVSKDTVEREWTLHDTINAVCCCLQSKQRRSGKYERIDSSSPTPAEEE